MTYTPYGVGVPTSQICLGPDGRVWYIYIVGLNLGAVTTSGVSSNYSSALPGMPYAISEGPDGNMWLSVGTGSNMNLVTVSLTGSQLTNVNYNIILNPGSKAVLTNVPYYGPSVSCWVMSLVSTINQGFFWTTGPQFQNGFSINTASSLNDFCVGSDGNLWSVAGSSSVCVFNLTTAASPTSYPLPYAGGAISTGPGGNLWITNNSQIMVVNTSGSVLATYTDTYGAGRMVLGADGNMYAYSASQTGMVQITPSGVQTAYPIPASLYTNVPSVGAYPVALSDGSIWFNDGSSNNFVWRFDPVTVIPAQICMIV